MSPTVPALVVRRLEFSLPCKYKNFILVYSRGNLFYNPGPDVDRFDIVIFDLEVTSTGEKNHKHSVECKASVSCLLERIIELLDLPQSIWLHSSSLLLSISAR